MFSLHIFVNIINKERVYLDHISLIFNVMYVWISLICTRCLLYFNINAMHAGQQAC